MRLSRHRLALFLLFGFIAVVSLSIASSAADKGAFTVQNFKVSDLPADDGSGLVLSWTPLPKERRIIEYRIYRGVEPKQLFFLSSIPVNVKTGVASETMYYYDNAPDEFIDLTSPSKLKQEKQQLSGSPIFGKPPRDINFLAKVAKQFSLLAVMEKNQYYYKTKKTLSGNDKDSTVYAGIKLRQAVVRAGLKTGSKYYYTVIAVDEKSNYHSYANIQEGIPQDNAPEAAFDFHGVLVQDKNRLQFEWDYPLYKDDLAQYRILLLPKLSSIEWEQAKYLPDLGGLKAEVIDSGPVNAPNYQTHRNYMIKDVSALTAKGLTSEQLKSGRYAIGVSDYSGMTTYSALDSLRLVWSSQLPPKPEFKVYDKKNDKGDRLNLVWSNPVVFITKVSFTSEQNTKMRINYQLNNSEQQKVKNVNFSFYKKGDKEPFKQINEYYQDNIITLKVPEGYDIKQGLHVKMTLLCKPALSVELVYEQDLNWDSQMLTIAPEKLFRNGKNISALTNVIYQKIPSMPIFYQTKKMTSYDNNLDITINYETQIIRLVGAVNIVKDGKVSSYGDEKEYTRPLQKDESKLSLLLMDPNIDLMVDPKTKKVIRTSIYASEGKKDLEQKLKKAKDNLTMLKAQQVVLAEQAKTSPEAAAQLAQLKDRITDGEKNLSLLDNPILKQVNGITNDHRRMHLIARTRETDKRRATFYMVVTAGDGLFSVSEEQKDKDNEYIYTAPISNWFDYDKLVALIACLIFGSMVVVFVGKARAGHDLYIRPIAGIHEIDNAIGRATEMGKPILYVMGAGDLSSIPIIASLGILSQVAKKAAEYDTRLIVPCYNYIVMPVAQEVVREAHYEAGRPDSYDKNNVFYLTDVQFAYVAGVNGIMIRENVVTNFFMGFFAAEALLMTETGNAVGAIQIAGSDAVTQIPFFITTCDYTLIGEELYAASAYLNREPMMLGTLKAQDYYKFLILLCIITGSVLSSLQVTGFIDIFPLK